MATLSRSDIVGQMQLAGVPRNVWPISTKETGRQHLRDFAKTARDSLSAKEGFTAAAFRIGDGGDTTDIEVFAKELVLAGETVTFLLFPELLRRLRSGWFDREGNDIAGKALVLPFVPMAESSKHEEGEYAEAISFIIQHAYQGNIVAAGIARRQAARTRASSYPSAFDRFITLSAQTFEV